MNREIKINSSSSRNKYNKEAAASENNEKHSGSQYSTHTTTGEEKMSKIEEAGSENNCEVTAESLDSSEVLARYYAALGGVGILNNEELKIRILGHLARPLMEEEVTRGERMGENAVCPQSWSLERTFKLASFQESEYKCYVEHFVDEVEVSSALDIVEFLMSRDKQVSLQDLFITADKILDRICEIQETDEFIELKFRYQESCHRGFDFSDAVRDGMLLGLTVYKRWGFRFDDYEMHHASVLARAWSNISSIENFHTYTFEVVSEMILDYMSMDTGSMCQEIMAQSKEEVCRTGGSHLGFLYDAVIASFINDPKDLSIEKLEEGRYFERAAEQARTRFADMFPDFDCEQAA